MQETLVQSLGQEDPLEKGMATHPSILAGEIPWKEEAAKESDMTQQLSTHTRTTCMCYFFIHTYNKY